MGPIGIFDSGFGGLSVFREIADRLPQYDYVYLGDNARAPYGSRSFEVVYEYTLQCVKWFFSKGCPLVILACNTASAKALRTIQQKDLPQLAPKNRVLGIIRPTAEVIGNFTKTKKVGVLGTEGTVKSMSYLLEIANFYPEVEVFQHSCPLWVPFVEQHVYNDDGIDPFIKRDIDLLFNQNQDIDVVLLACTHYPLLSHKIKKFLPKGVTLISQGSLVADSLADYLQRHPEMEKRLSKGGSPCFFTTDSAEEFEKHGKIFWRHDLQADRIEII